MKGKKRENALFLSLNFCCVLKKKDLFRIAANLALEIDTLGTKQKQEVHGPHRSPEKTVQINKHI